MVTRTQGDKNLLLSAVGLDPTPTEIDSPVKKTEMKRNKKFKVSAVGFETTPTEIE